ncbi:MAG TPA: hypothetical protein VIJ15_08710, partial [Dermatophilaceae bacterium]
RGSLESHKAVTHDVAVITTNTAMHARHNIVALRDMDSGRPESPTVTSPSMRCRRSHGTTLSSPRFTHIGRHPVNTPEVLARLAAK